MLAVFVFSYKSDRPNVFCMHLHLAFTCVFPYLKYPDTDHTPGVDGFSDWKQHCVEKSDLGLNEMLKHCTIVYNTTRRILTTLFIVEL